MAERGLGPEADRQLAPRAGDTSGVLRTLLVDGPRARDRRAGFWHDTAAAHQARTRLARTPDDQRDADLLALAQLAEDLSTMIARERRRTRRRRAREQGVQRALVEEIVTLRARVAEQQQTIEALVAVAPHH